MIDIAKGISIVMVVLAHSELGRELPQVDSALSLVRMPLFFFLSGIFFLETRTFGDVVARRTESLLKPYFVTQLALFGWGLLQSRPDPLHSLAGIVYGVGPTIRWVPMWFLTHLWLVHVVAWALMRATRISGWPPARQAAFLALLAAAGAMTIGWFSPWHIDFAGVTRQLPGLPFSLDIVLVTVTFFLTGRLLRDQVRSFSPRLGLALLATLVFACIYALTDAAIGMNERIYRQPVFATVAALSGIYLVLSIARLLEQTSAPRRLFAWLGSGSIFILIFHNTIEGRTYRLLSTSLADLPDPLCAVLAYVAAIALSMLIRAVIIRSEFLSMLYLPQGKMHFRNLQARFRLLSR